MRAACILPRALLLCVSVFVTAATCYSRSDAPPVDAARALTELPELERKHTESAKKRRDGATSAVRQAATTGTAAGRLYEEARQAGGEQDWADRKKKNADLPRDKIFQQAVQMHLRYLQLSLERGDSEDPARWAEPSMQYARDVARLLADKNYRQGPGPARDLLTKPLTDGPFVRWMQLGPLLPAANVWEQVPGNLAGILEKNVRTPWRQASDPRIDTAWQLELETGAALATADGSDLATQEFNTRTAPALLFRRARDRAAAGQPNRAATDLLDLARRHPDHPDFPQWATALREMLEKKTTPAHSP